MGKTKKRFAAFLGVFAVLTFGLIREGRAGQADLERLLSRSEEVLNEIMATPDESIPEELLARCRAIAIYPSLIKGGFIAGALYGDGVVLRRDKGTGNWGPVSFSKIRGLSAGLQIGIQATDLVLVVLNNRGLESLLSSRITLGADFAISVGPVGRTTLIGTDLPLKAGILSYSKSRGLFGGAALDGVLVMPDTAGNRLYYGKDISAKEILLGNNVVEIQPSSRRLIETLTRHSNSYKSFFKKK